MQESSNQTLRLQADKIFVQIEAALADDRESSKEAIDFIDQLQNIIAEHYPLEAPFVVFEIERNIHLFPKNLKDYFSWDQTPKDLLEAIKEVYLKIKETPISLDKDMAKYFEKLLFEENFGKSEELFLEICRVHKADDIIKWISANKINESYTKNNNTILHFFAQTQWNTTIAKIVDRFKDTNINCKNLQGAFPLDVAVVNKKQPFIKEIIAGKVMPAATYDFLKKNKETYHETYEYIKKPYRDKKSEIMGKKPLFSVFSAGSAVVNPLQAICSQVYYEGHKNLLSKPLVELLNQFLSYEKSTLLAPLLYVVALAAIGKHARGIQSGKPFKIVGSSEENLASLLIGSTGVGTYTEKNTLFVALGNDLDSVTKNLQILFHEAAHFVALEIMNNACNPFTKVDEESQVWYQKVIDKVRHDFSEEIFNDPQVLQLPEDEQNVIAMFFGVFRMYNESQWGSELFVTFAQTIAVLGYDRGCEFLQTYTPDFFEFYKDNFLPKCMDYLNAHDVQQHLELEESFVDSLNAAKSSSDSNGLTPTNASK